MLSDLNSRFSIAPTDIDIRRSRFTIPYQHKTTFNTGDLIPLLVQEVLPGDTFSVDMSAAVRMTTPIFPVMDNAELDTWFFFVPNRLVWEHWREFCGENRTTAWEQTIDYEVPYTTAPADGWQKGTIADYMGIPTKVSGLNVMSLPFRAYCLVWNEWFRDQNLKDPCMVNLDDATQQGSNGSSYVSDAQLGGMPLKVAKPHDYFTSSLPEPQKGPDVLLPLGDYATVTTGDPAHPGEKGLTVPEYPLYMTSGLGGKSPSFPGVDTLLMTQSFTGASYFSAAGSTVPSLGQAPIAPYNLYADLGNATAATVNQLRQAFAVQRFYERLARGGSRYTEIVRSMFGVTSPDARQQRPEYLGGLRVPVNVDQVLQTSATDSTSPQGNTAAYSLTNVLDSVFTHSFTEHGFMLCVVAVRTKHTYQQGLERFWSRRSKFDFYWPPLANLGEQAILNKEIYAQGTDEDDQAFGYQEAWADYRYKPDRVSGAFRSNYAQTLDSWHYADFYASIPRLSSEWIDETSVNVDRTLAVSKEQEDQFLGDFMFRMTAVRPMPLYSIPGLIDHF